MRSAILVGLLAGCTPIYDAQYDDRREELEQHRELFLEAASDVQLIASGEQRLFWVDVVPPADQEMLHSIDPADPNSKIDYEWSLDDSSFDDFHFGPQVIADCASTSRLYATGGSNTLLGMTSMGFENCAVDGDAVYFLIGSDTLKRWTGTGDPVDFVNFEAAGIAGAVSGFGVIGNLVIAAESDGDIYRVDVNGTTATATWLMQEGQVGGNLFFDEQGVLYQSINPSGIRYIRFADLAKFSFDELVADGGYHLNFKHGDIQTPVENEFVIHDRHIIYRGQRGIFAYGLDTRNVIDLLLEEGEGFDRVVAYRDPVVTSGGFLFVRSGDGISDDGPVYRVDLNGRLR